MAGKRMAGKGSTGKTGGRKPPIRARVIDAALTLAAVKGWRALDLRDIADAAGVSLAELHDNFASKQAILTAYIDEVDRTVLKGAAPSDEPVRDRLFDVVMRRFDALAPRKHAIRAIARDLLCDPVAAARLVLRLRLSMAWMLEAAGLSSGGIEGAIRTKGLLALYLATLRVWLADDSEDHAKTMAYLDRRLGEAERILRSVASIRRAGSAAG